MLKERIEYDLVDDFDQESPAEKREFTFREVNYESTSATTTTGSCTSLLDQYATAETRLLEFVAAAHVAGSENVAALLSEVAKHEEAHEGRAEAQDAQPRQATTRPKTRAPRRPARVATVVTPTPPFAPGPRRTASRSPTEARSPATS